ncbi:gas vesicle protein K [Actinomadura madurae]|uniref:gas vesicle protein K n=1 Tax=Actinomadura madurae TaxID=1993 RepID=UPI0020268F55|nr:gas vesicle protein K [Actinomadura madurae]URN04117.1 gas vesicle protein K [Actinomadura madurae]
MSRRPTRPGPGREPVRGEVSVHDPAEGDPFTDDILAGRTASYRSAADLTGTDLTGTDWPPSEGAVPVRAAPAREMGPRERSSRTMQRLRSDPETVERDLVKLVLTLVELVRQLMERQALRRAEGGDLTEEQVEALGLALMRLEEAMGRLKDHFGLDEHDLNLDLGPLGPLLPED